MKTVRILAVSFAFIMLGSNVLAQSNLDYTVTSFDTNWADVSSGSEHDFNYHVLNTSKDTLTIYFSRTQRLAAGWTSSVCWGTQCYASGTDSVAFPIPPSQFAVLSLHLNPALDDTPDSGTVWLRLGIADSSLMDTTLLLMRGSYTPGNPPLVFQWSDTVRERIFTGPGIWTLSNFLENHAARGINYSLSLQASFPSGWSLTFCDRQNPNSNFNTEDTCVALDAPLGIASLTSHFSSAYDTTYRQPIKFTLDAPSVSHEDSAVIYLSVHPITSNLADSANYRFVMHVLPQSGVAASTDDRAGLAVTNAWPNPLYIGGKLHLDILTDQDGPATASIYDLSGTAQSTIDLGMLQSGANHVQIGAPNLTSGEYIIYVEQGKAKSEAVRVNYIK